MMSKYFLLNDFVYFIWCPREKAKWKEREEAWLKIENLAKSNPQVSKEILTILLILHTSDILTDIFYDRLIDCILVQQYYVSVITMNTQCIATRWFNCTCPIAALESAPYINVTQICQFGEVIGCVSILHFLFFSLYSFWCTLTQ